MTHLCLPVILFPQPILSLLNRLMNIVGGQQGRKLYTGSAVWTSLSKADLVTATAEYPFCQQQEPTQSPHYSTIPQVICPLTGGRLITLNHFHH